MWIRKRKLENLEKRLMQCEKELDGYRKHMVFVSDPMNGRSHIEFIEIDNQTNLSTCVLGQESLKKK